MQQPDLPILQNIEYKDTVKYIPTVTSGKVIKVYDGDTITIASQIDASNPTIYRFSVRLHGIDSPEIKGKTENEKLLAKQSRDALHDLIYNKMVILENVNTEKYGRLLADVKYGDIHVNKWMLDNNYAVSYDGGKKLIPCEWE
jgi:endonuclease YncB( thermonuclease family)